MIIIGYQGIGKSSISCAENNCIDLESSNFWYNDKRDKWWYVYYCNLAVDLSEQGFTVFVSSHKEVRDYLLNFIDEGTIICMFPEPYLKDKWIEKLENRYKKDPSEKNYKALMNTKDRFEENVNEMRASGYLYYGISDMDYNLLDIVKYLREQE